MTSSLETADTRPRCISTTQSGIPRRDTTSSRSGRARSTPSVVDPSDVHTRCPAQVLDLAHAAADRHQQPLRRGHVGAGELDAALAVAGDGEVVDDQVDLAALHRRTRSAMSSTTNWTLSGSPRIAFAIECAMSMSAPTQLPGLRVAVAGEVLALVDARRSTGRARRSRPSSSRRGIAPAAGSGPVGRRLSRTPVQAGLCVGLGGADVALGTAPEASWSGAAPPGSSSAPSASTPATHR